MDPDYFSYVPQLVHEKLPQAYHGWGGLLQSQRLIFRKYPQPAGAESSSVPDNQKLQSPDHHPTPTNLYAQPAPFVRVDSAAMQSDNPNFLSWNLGLEWL